MFELSRDSVPEDSGEQKLPRGPLHSHHPSFQLVPSAPDPKKDDDAEQLPTSAGPETLASEMKYCSYCERRVATVVELQPSFLSFFVCFFFFLTCGWISLCVIPFVWPLLQVVVHHCPLCNDVLDSKRRFSCFKVRDEVVTLRVGSCAIVLSRAYVLALAVMVTLISTAYGVRWYLQAFGLPDIAKGEPIDASWTDFLRDCGFKGYLGNPVKAEALFANRYRDKTVTWSGRMHHVQEGIFSKHFVHLNMDPRQYQRSDVHDLALILAQTALPGLPEVDQGDLLTFEATLLELGKRGRPHLGVLWDFNITTKNSDLPPMQNDWSRFVVIRNQIGRPPVDFPGVARRYIDRSVGDVEGRDKLVEYRAIEDRGEGVLMNKEEIKEEIKQGEKDGEKGGNVNNEESDGKERVHEILEVADVGVVHMPEVIKELDDSAEFAGREQQQFAGREPEGAQHVDGNPEVVHQPADIKQDDG